MDAKAKPPGFLRLLAFALDWCVIAAWGGAVFGLVWFLSDGAPQQLPNPWLAQGLGFLVMTLPTTLYFSVLESSRHQASLGKRVLGLRVQAVSGKRLTFGPSLQRSALKFLPWEMGHMVAQQSIFADDSGVPAWVYLPMALSFALPLWWVLSLGQRTNPIRRVVGKPGCSNSCRSLVAAS